MKCHSFGQLPDGRAVTAYELGEGDLVATVLDYGGTLQSLKWKGRDMIGGFDTIRDYLQTDGHQGALIGRYANRIKDAKFTLRGVTYTLAKIDGENHRHGGVVGYDKRMWSVQKPSDSTDTDAHSLTLTLTDPDGTEGYPGTVQVTVTYTVSENTLSIHYRAVSDQDTPFNMTNHSYFNMNGTDGGPVYDQTLQIFADTVSLVDDWLIPYGSARVDGTLFDFRTPKLLSRDLLDAEDAQMQNGSGLDHNFYINRTRPVSLGDKTLYEAAVFSGRLASVTVYTDMPCIQCYAGNFMDGPNPFYGHIKREKRHGLCLETQYAPDGPNRGEAILRAGDVYDHTTWFRFA